MQAFLDAALTAEAHWNLNEALHLYRCAAALGSAEAAAEVARLTGWASSFAESHYLTREAGRGSGEACVHLGLFASGEPDLNEAKYWFDRGASLGHPEAAAHAAALRKK